ncbi:MAG: response regulator [Eubacteriales bacterium]|nr:response regulator [Eubacteriales bacterium]
MYRVLIIDDEKFIRKSIRNRMDWEAFGITEIAEAGNGEEALALMDSFQPQIVLVDIRMPKMDGLGFIKEAKKKHPAVDYVIMSAYSDFSYARTAISLGVEAYLLKPINKKELEELLQKLLHKIHEKELSSMNRSVKTDEVEQLGILKYDYVTALAFYSAQEDTGEKLAVILQDQIREYQDCCAYFLRNCSRSTCYVFLINAKEDSRKITGMCAEYILDAMGNLELKAAVSEAFIHGQFREAIAQSIAFLKRKMFSPERNLITYSLCESKEYMNQKNRIREELGQIYSQIRKEEFTLAKEALLDVINHLVQKTTQVALIEDGINEILVLLSHLPGNEGGNVDLDILFHDFKSRDYLLVYQTEEELKMSLKNLVHGLFEAVQKRDSADVTLRIKEYIEKNYGDPLNAAEIAGKYGLSVSYLSTFFKEKTGMNLTAYIEGVRMEKAKDLLKNREWTVTDVAIHTGYSNSNYFSKVFKKYVGVTPREFREIERRREI